MKHETYITGLPVTPGSRAVTAPTILRFEEPDFVNVFLEELRRPDWRAALEARRVESDPVTGHMLVEQPVHRAFYLVVVDVRCLIAGVPRLDPAKVVSSGVSIRRLSKGQWLGWMREGDAARGWQAVPPGATEITSTYEPKADLRQARALGRNVQILSRLDRLPSAGDGMSEDVIPLFRVPADVAEATGMSLLYGFLPVSSDETEPETGADQPPFDITHVADRVPRLLGTSHGGISLPPVAGTIGAAEMVDPEGSADQVRGAGLRTLKSALTWLAQECGAFSGGAQAGAVKAALNAVALEGADRNRLFDFFEYAYQVLILRGWLDSGRTDVVPTSVSAPEAWPELTQDQLDALQAAALAAMSERWADVAPLTPRYPAGKRVYQLNCFIRLDDCEGCPPRIVWSAPSDRFQIKPWYEGGEAPPVQIELPSLGLDSLKSLKPNVAVKVPPELQQHMDRIDLGKLLNGEHTKTEISLGMICGFSIPIITICAFIILQIFLQILNIIFFWLPFVRICIPFPRIETEDE